MNGYRVFNILGYFDMKKLSIEVASIDVIYWSVSLFGEDGVKGMDRAVLSS